MKGCVSRGEARRRQGEQEAGAARGRSRVLGRGCRRAGAGRGSEGEPSSCDPSARWCWGGYRFPSLKEKVVQEGAEKEKREKRAP